MWPVYVINLADNSARMARSAAQLEAQGIPFERIEGVNGWAISDDEIAKVYDPALNRKRAKYPLVRPEVGCYLSHILAWKRIAEGKLAGGFIFEDDFQAGLTLAAALEELSQDEGWDMVKLFSLNPDVKLFAERPLGQSFTIGFPARVPTCLLGYGLTRTAAARLLETAPPIARPVDEDQKFFWETGLRVALIRPQPLAVGEQDATTGTIGQARRKDLPLSPPRRAVAQAFHGLRYQLSYRLKLFWHNLKRARR
jgi:glycosyl transferase family 25